MILIGEGRLAPGKLLKKRSGASFVGKLEPTIYRCSCLLSIEGQAKSNMQSKSLHLTKQRLMWDKGDVLEPFHRVWTWIHWNFWYSPIAFIVSKDSHPVHTQMCTFQNGTLLSLLAITTASQHHHINCWNAIRLTDFTNSALMGFILGKFVFRCTHPAVPQKAGNMVLGSQQVWTTKKQHE